ncbi:MAG: PLP-dependent aminotransferase family protein [Chloroflexi bacterium]|nr:PLP-dependent aminotransferase family protein [Chloroflexota bacterium]
MARFGRRRVATALTVPLDERGSLSLQQQLYTRLRDDILARRLRPGERLPPSRSLAGQLAVSRTTVVLVYEQLVAEGYAEARQGAGTFVSRQIPDDALAAARRPRLVALPHGHPADGDLGNSGAASAADDATDRDESAGVGLLSAWGGRMAEVHRQVWGGDGRVAERYGPLPFDFRPGRPDWDTFPRQIWGRLTARQVRERSEELASYGDPAGYRPLREAIATHLGQTRGVRCSAEQVVVVNGSQQGADLLIRLCLDPGDRAALEDPGYAGAALTLRAHGMSVAPVPVDDDGLDVAALPAPDADDAPRLVYVTPSHQFPTGATLSLPRRLRLLEWAARRGATIVEDDYDSDFRYSGRPLESLQGLDTHGVVAYVGSFSKALFPPLRVGFVVLPPRLVEPFVAAKWLADRQTATLDQQVLSDFIGEGHFERHLRRMRRLYQSRRDSLLEAIRREPGAELMPGGDGAGLHLVGWLPADADAVALAEEAARLGVATPALDPYYQGKVRRPGLMLGFAALDEERIAEGVRRLAQAARRIRRARQTVVGPRVGDVAMLEPDR